MRARSRPLTATRVRTEQRIELAQGAYVDVRPGDWLISRGALVVDWARGAALDEKYEILHDGVLTVPASVAQRLERTTGIGTTQDPYALAEAVERLATIQIGTVRVDFTPGQLEELAHRAGKRGHTVAQELAAAVERVAGEIFHRG